MNLVLLTGNLVRDPEKTYSSTGMAITKFTIAVNRNFSKKTEGGKDADFIRITCFDKRAEFVEKYLTKGRKVGVEARVQTDSYQGKDGNTVYTTEFIANNIEFLDSKRDTEGGGSYQGGGYQNRQDSGSFGGSPEAEFDRPAAPPAGAGADSSGDGPPMPDDFVMIDEDNEDVPF